MHNDEMLEQVQDILTVSQVQEVLSIGRSMVYRMLEKGELKSVRIGKCYRIPKYYLLEYIREKTRSSLECQEEMQ